MNPERILRNPKASNSYFTPREVLPALSSMAMDAFCDHLDLDQIPDGFGLSIYPHFRKRVKKFEHKKQCGKSSSGAKARKAHPQLIIIMVGLPARGKSYTASKICSFLQWIGINTRVFNVGMYRRQVLPHTIDQSAQFFEASNLTAKKIRDQLAAELLDQLFEWLREGGEVAIFDATNTTDERRRHILSRCYAHKPVPQVIFIENICDDPYVLAENFKQKILISPDYEYISVEGASLDLQRRIVNYEKVYETITDSNLSYIKIFNLKTKVICNHITGTLPKIVCHYVLKLHVQSRSIWFARSAQCNLPEDVSMEASEFTENGIKYTKRLAEFVQKRLQPAQLQQLVIFTSTNARAISTAQYIQGATIIPTSVINGLDGGICHNMTPQQIATTLPEVWKHWDEDRFNYRLPGGESFADMIQRLRYFVLELEQLRCPVLIITHTTAIQGLYAYFKQIDVETAPYYYVPQNTIVELVSTKFGWKEKHYSIHSPQN